MKMKNLPITPFNERNVNIILESIGFELDETKRILYKGKIRNCTTNKYVMPICGFNADVRIC